MKVLAINSVPYGSTAKIMIGIGKCCEKSQSDIHYFTATGFSTHSLKEMPSNNIIIGGGYRVYGQSQYGGIKNAHRRQAVFLCDLQRRKSF